MSQFNGYATSNGFIDAQRAQQDFDLRKQAAQVDNQAKQLSLVGQIVGNNSIDQQSYDRARQTAASQGLDISALPDQFNPDVVNRLRFAGATPTAQLSALIASQGHDLKAGIAAGNVGGYGFKGSTPQAPAAPASAPTPSANMTDPTTQSSPLLDAQQGANMQSLYGDDSQPTTQPVNIQQPPNTAPVAPRKFVVPPQNPGETIDAYKQRLSTNSDVLSSEENAKKTGVDRADANKAKIGANANYDQIVQTIGGIKALNNDPTGLPQSRYFVPSGAQAALAQNLGDTTIGNVLGVPSQKVADNYNAFSKLNEAQTIGAIKELASTGQIRMTRTLENILNKGYLIEPGASPASKEQQANLILAELNNSKIAAQNVDAGLSGGQATPYQQMPVAAQAKQVVKKQYSPSTGKTKLTYSDGTEEIQ